MATTPGGRYPYIDPPYGEVIPKLQAFQRLVETDFNLVAGGIINVKGQPGVVADGVTDDHDAIQAILDANPNAIILFEEAEFVSDGSQILTDDTGRDFRGRLLGRNGGTVRFTNDGSATDEDIDMQRGFVSYPKVNGGGGDSSGLGDGVVFEDLHVIGPAHGASVFCANSSGVTFRGGTYESNRYGLVLETSIAAIVDRITFVDNINAGLFLAFLNDTARVYYASGTPEASYWNDSPTTTNCKFVGGGHNIAGILDHGSNSQSIRSIDDSNIFVGCKYGYLARKADPTIKRNWFEDVDYPVRLLTTNASLIALGDPSDLVGITAAEPDGTYSRTNFPDGNSFTCDIKGNMTTRAVNDFNLQGVSSGTGFIGQNISTGLSGIHLILTEAGGLIIDSGDTIAAGTYKSVTYPTTYIKIADILVAPTLTGPVTINGATTLQGAAAALTIKPQDGSGSDFTLYNPTGDDLKINVSGVGDVLSLNALGHVGINIIPDRPFVISSATNPLAAGQASLLLQGAANKERIEIRSFGASASPGFQGVGAGGTVASPTRTINNGLISFLGGGGYDNAGTPALTGNKALLAFRAQEDWTTAAQGSSLIIELTPAGSTARAEKLRLSGEGLLGVGTGATISARVHSLSTTEQLRLGNTAASYAAFTVSSTGSLNIAPTSATVANLGFWGPTFGTDANKNLVIGTGATVPTSTWSSFPSGAHFFVKEEVDLLLGGTGVSTASKGSHLNIWAPGVAVRGHMAVGDFQSVDPLLSDGVDKGIITSYYPSIILNVRGDFTGDMSATGTDPATGFTVAKRQTISSYLSINATHGLKLEDEIYGVRSLVYEGSSAITHLGKIYAVAGEFAHNGSAQVNTLLCNTGAYYKAGSGNVLDVKGCLGWLRFDSGATGTITVGQAVDGNIDVQSGASVILTGANCVRGFIANAGALTSSDLRTIRASAPVNTGSLAIDLLTGVSIGDHSGLAGVARAWNLYSFGVNSQNGLEGALVLGGRPLEADTLPQFGLLQGQSAYGLASTNVTGGDLTLMGGFGRRLFTVVDIASGNVILTITVNGTGVTLEGSTSGAGVQFAYGASTSTAATALAAAINAHSTLNTKVFAVASSASVYLRRRGSLRTLTIATNQAGRTSVTSGNDGNVILGGPIALATNATDGFAHIPTCAGAPSGTPTAVTGKVPMVYDTTNDHLYVYRAGWKKTTVFA